MVQCPLEKVLIYWANISYKNLIRRDGKFLITPVLH